MPGKIHLQFTFSLFAGCNYSFLSEGVVCEKTGLTNNIEKLNKI